MGKIKYIVKGIGYPGRINVLLGGRFRNVDLHTATQDVLEQLYKQNIPFVGISDGTETTTAGPEIKVKAIAKSKKQHKSGN